MRRGARASLLGLLLAAAAGACATASGDANRGGVGAAIGGDPRPAIERVLDAQVAAWNRGDLEAFMDGYWRSADLIFTSGGAVQRGWQTTLDRYRASYGTSPETMGRLAFSDLEVYPLGPGAAWALGRWNLNHEDGGTVGGVFSLVFRDVDGEWVIVHDHTSIAAP